jgi:hypothetical protein
MSFVEEAFEEIPDLERKEILANEKVRSLISQKSARVSEKTYGNCTIKFRTSINKKLRSRLIKAKSHLEGDEMDEFLYGTLAHLCVDTPWNNWKTWSVYDNELPEDGIGAFEIFTDLLMEVKNQTESIKGFR